jgi:tetratricopeptide (TPR) repeat protein
MLIFHRLGWISAVAVYAFSFSGSLRTQSQVQTPIVTPLATVSTANPQPSETRAADVTPEDVGDALMLHQRYQAAIEAYQNAAQNSSNVWNKMGIAYQLMFSVGSAAHCYQMAIKLDPNNANALNNLGTMYDANRQFEEAERMYRRALKLDPRSPILYRNLGTALMSRHKFAEGAEAYQTALSLDPQIFLKSLGPTVDNQSTARDRGAMHFYIAKSCVHAGMNQRAVDYLRKAINEGYTDARKVFADSDFASLHGFPAFEELAATFDGR